MANERQRKVMTSYHSFAQADLDEDRGGRYSMMDGKPAVTAATEASAIPQMPDGPWSTNPYPEEPLVDGRGEGNVTGYEIDRPDAPPSSQPEGGGVVDGGPTTDTSKSAIRPKGFRRV